LADLFNKRHQTTINGIVIRNEDEFVCPQCKEPLPKSWREVLEIRIDEYHLKNPIWGKGERFNPIVADTRGKCSGCGQKFTIGIVWLPESQSSPGQQEK